MYGRSPGGKGLFFLQSVTLAMYLVGFVWEQILAIVILDTLCLRCLKICTELKLISPFAPLTKIHHPNCLVGKRYKIILLIKRANFLLRNPSRVIFVRRALYWAVCVKEAQLYRWPPCRVLLRKNLGTV